VRTMVDMVSVPLQTILKLISLSTWRHRLSLSSLVINVAINTEGRIVTNSFVMRMVRTGQVASWIVLQNAEICQFNSQAELKRGSFSYLNSVNNSVIVTFFLVYASIIYIYIYIGLEN
jgi:hypothetical protein